MSMNDFNNDVINEFRANEGKLGGGFEGSNMVLVHHTGARTGTERVAPLAYRAEDDGWVIFASKAGAPDNPDWFHNLKANPATCVEVGSEKIDVTAIELTGAERERIWELQKVEVPTFAEYEAKTDRIIPVILLERR
ncbi:MAG: deazaflavin-dependent oxidoreductase (nitroreductase family) [Candidatus Aldehydirespiratoraceae bacterium]|jgi:deazaflavin-dependent oxidoreductase (nitroreductase family)